MSAKTRIPLAEAQGLADELVYLLAPGCERIHIAGSVRRGGDAFGTVGDIEIVCSPRVERTGDLFSPDGGAEWNELDALCNELRLDGVLANRLDANDRPAWGSRHKRALYKGLGLDLFAVIPPASYGCILAIRTGPRWFSKALVVPVNKTVYTDDGRPLCPGLMPTWLKHEGGRYVHLRDGEPVGTPDEADVFKLLRIEYIPPQERDAFITARAAAGAAR